MIVKLLTEHHLECLSLKGGCTGSSESTHVKIPHCWKSHALAHMISPDVVKIALFDFISIKLYKTIYFINNHETSHVCSDSFFV